MPTYDFKCSGCDHEGEMNISFKIMDEIQTCPECNEQSYVRQFSVNPHPNFDFVGKGWYVTDYGKKAWKKNLSPNEQSKVLTGERAPY